MSAKVHLVRVFADGPAGGNPAPIVADATGMSDADMQDVARSLGHESAFVFPSPPNTGCDFQLRFWVPNHEMEMCGHAAVAAVWLLAQLGRLPHDELKLSTRSGFVHAQVLRLDQGDHIRVEVSQPLGQVEPVSRELEEEILRVLGIARDELACYPIQNACTSRWKTLVPLSSLEQLGALKPRYSQIEELCDKLGTSGLYPYAVEDGHKHRFHARQFPKSSGYPEDPATGIAAAALSFGLLEQGLVDPKRGIVRVLQGSAMGRPSEILVRLEDDQQGNVLRCWLSGRAELMDS